MNRRRLVLVSVGVVAAMAALGGAAWLSLPAGAEVPIHWGVDGRPDGFADKTIALFSIPAGALLLTAVFALLPAIEPRRRNLEQSPRLYRAAWLGMLALFAAIQLGVVAAALDPDFEVSRAIMAGTGVLMIVIGNYLPTTRSTWFIGIRTPWTLSSERSWERTHRLGGRLFVLFGLALLAGALLGVPGELMVPVLLVGVALTTIVPMAYSYVVWRDDPARRPNA